MAHTRKSKSIYAVGWWETRERSFDKASPTVTASLAMLIATSQPREGWYVPTEVVVRSPQIVTPVSALYWCLQADEVRALMNYTLDQWPDHTHREGGKYQLRNEAYLVQRWSDCGDDGHTDHRLVGYALLRAEDFEQYLAYQQAYSAAKTYIDAYAIDEVCIEAPSKHCGACNTVSCSTDWTPDEPGGWPRCPNCGMV